MKIIRAEAMGLCFGVRDALALAGAQPAPRDVTIHGELVHNDEVLRGLRERGFAITPESGRDAVPATPAVMITAHGVSDRERQRLQDAGKVLVDTTCPLVARAHRAARALAAECDHVVVIGVPGHVEVLGLTGDLPSSDVVATPADARRYAARRLGVLCQTTFPVHRAARILAALEQANPHAVVRFVDTICEPTKQRMRALLELIDQADAVVVVGGARSNNTRELVGMCEARGVPAHHVQAAADLDAGWFGGCRTVGLTAGTSTPDRAVDEVYDALRALAGQDQGGA